jgi:hypothetical protein
VGQRCAPLEHRPQRPSLRLAGLSPAFTRRLELKCHRQRVLVLLDLPIFLGDDPQPHLDTRAGGKAQGLS